MIKNRTLTCLMVLTALSLSGFAVMADENLGVTQLIDPATGAPVAEAPVPPEVLILRKIEQELKEKYKTEIYVPPAIPSLIFTPSQQSLLREARNGFNTRIPTEAETLASSGAAGSLQQPAMAVRKLSLGGIVFISPDEWTIWLNKRRITPDKLPTEAVDLRVYKEFIELRWFDAQTNQIYPIRLRPNQTFGLDAHTFIPG